MRPAHPPTCIAGYHNLVEALRAGRPLAKVFIGAQRRDARSRHLIQKLRSNGIPIQRVPSVKLKKLTKQWQEGYVGIVAPISFQQIEKIIPAVFEQGQWPFVVVADRLTDVRNFGAIVRTAEAVGVHAIVVPEKASACVQNDMIKTSSGAIYHVPICRTRALQNTVRYLKEMGLRVVSCSEKGKTQYHEARLNGPLAIVVGGEHRGVSSDLLALSDETVRIPMKGRVEALNASVAFGILSYEALRQRDSSQ